MKKEEVERIARALTNGVFEKPYSRRLTDGRLGVFVADDQLMCVIPLPDDDYDDWDAEIAHAICEAGLLIKKLSQDIS